MIALFSASSSLYKVKIQLKTILFQNTHRYTHVYKHVVLVALGAVIKGKNAYIDV